MCTSPPQVCTSPPPPPPTPPLLEYELLPPLHSYSLLQLECEFHAPVLCQGPKLQPATALPPKLQPAGPYLSMSSTPPFSARATFTESLLASWRSAPSTALGTGDEDGRSTLRGKEGAGGEVCGELGPGDEDGHGHGEGGRGERGEGQGGGTHTSAPSPPVSACMPGLCQCP